MTWRWVSENWTAIWWGGKGTSWDDKVENRGYNLGLHRNQRWHIHSMSYMLFHLFVFWLWLDRILGFDLTRRPNCGTGWQIELLHCSWLTSRSKWRSSGHHSRSLSTFHPKLNVVQVFIRCVSPIVWLPSGVEPSLASGRPGLHLLMITQSIRFGPINRPCIPPTWNLPFDETMSILARGRRCLYVMPSLVFISLGFYHASFFFFYPFKIFQQCTLL